MDILEQLVNDIMSREERPLLDTDILQESPAMDDLKNKLQRPNIKCRVVQKSHTKYHKIQSTPDKSRRMFQCNSTRKDDRNRCCVDGCTETDSRRLFKFPDELENLFAESKSTKGDVVSRRRLWELKLLGGVAATSEDRVCSNHFEDKYLKYSGSQKWILKDSSVPTLNLPCTNEDKTANGEAIEQETQENSDDTLGDDSWNIAKTMCLIERWSLHRKSSTALDKNPLVWNAVAEDMNLMGFPGVKGASCYLKFRFLVKRYEDIKERKGKGKKAISWRYYDELDKHFKIPSNINSNKAKPFVLRPDGGPDHTQIVHLNVSKKQEQKVKLILKEATESSSIPKSSTKPVLPAQIIPNTLTNRPVQPSTAKSSFARLLGTSSSPVTTTSSMSLRPRTSSGIVEPSSRDKDTEEIPPSGSSSPVTSDKSAFDLDDDLEIDFEPENNSEDDPSPPKWFVEFEKRQRLEQSARAERDAKIISLLKKIEQNTQKQVDIFSKLRLKSSSKTKP